MAFGSIVLEGLLAGLHVGWGKGWVYPGDDLDEVERGGHAQYVVHTDRESERAGTVEVRIVLCHRSQHCSQR